MRAGLRARPSSEDYPSVKFCQLVSTLSTLSSTPITVPLPRSSLLVINPPLAKTNTSDPGSWHHQLCSELLNLIVMFTTAISFLTGVVLVMEKWSCRDFKLFCIDECDVWIWMSFWRPRVQKFSLQNSEPKKRFCSRQYFSNNIGFLFVVLVKCPLNLLSSII